MLLPCVSFQNALFTIMVFLPLASQRSCLGFLTTWWLVSKKNSKRKETEAASPLKSRVQSPRTSFPSYSIGQSNHRSRSETMGNKLHLLMGKWHMLIRRKGIGGGHLWRLPQCRTIFPYPPKSLVPSESYVKFYDLSRG